MLYALKNGLKTAAKISGEALTCTLPRKLYNQPAGERGYI